MADTRTTLLDATLRVLRDRGITGISGRVIATVFVAVTRATTDTGPPMAASPSALRSDAGGVAG